MDGRNRCSPTTLPVGAPQKKSHLNEMASSLSLSKDLLHFIHDDVDARKQQGTVITLNILNYSKLFIDVKGMDILL
jgi:hypothetical protein